MSEVIPSVKRLLCLMTALLFTLCAAPGLAAEDVFTVDITQAGPSLTSDRSYLRVTCTLDCEANVTLSIRDESGALVYQRDHGLCSGRFRSEDVYLRLTGSATAYQVTLQAGDTAYSAQLMRIMPRLTGNAACSVGLPLRSITGADTWKSATLLDLSTLASAPVTVPLHASGAYELGTVTFSMSGGQLIVTAQLAPGVDGSIDGSTVCAATTALEAMDLGRKSFAGPTGRLNQPIDLFGAAYAAVYVNLTVSFDPAGLPASPATTLPGQDHLWNLILTQTANEALG